MQITPAQVKKLRAQIARLRNEAKTKASDPKTAHLLAVTANELELALATGRTSRARKYLD